MAAFSRHESEWQRLDLRLFQNSPVALYFCPDVLDEDVAQLRSEGYRIDEFECTQWRSESDFHADMAARLAFPDYYGRNLNAFNDCMSDIEVPEYGGRAIVLRRFDLFAKSEPAVAQNVLDIMASTSWYLLLFGRRLLTIVQSDDPRISFEGVGAHAVMWNPREWLNKNRGLSNISYQDSDRGSVGLKICDHSHQTQYHCLHRLHHGAAQRVSKPLHIPEPFQWVLIIGVFVPIGLAFYFIKISKREKAEASGTGETLANPATTSTATEQQKKTKRNLWLGMVLGCAVGLCAPLWLPWTGTTLGPKGDFVVGLITVAICCTIFGLRLRKL
jgi:RNAse (barnase) inhibitor barstar